MRAYIWKYDSLILLEFYVHKVDKINVLFVFIVHLNLTVGWQLVV